MNPSTWAYVLMLSMIKSIRSVLFLLLLALVFGILVLLIEGRSLSELYVSILDKGLTVILMALALLPWFIVGDVVRFKRKLAGRRVSDVDRRFVKQSLFPDTLKILERWRD